jgi:hypothetical protein
MYNQIVIDELINFIHNNPNLSKEKLTEAVVKKFQLTKDRSVYYNKYYAIRFSKSSSDNFSNTVLGLSTLQKYDHLPFIICLNTPNENKLMLANTSFLKKISHSSHKLRRDNIRGSFNGTDIVRRFGTIENNENNFEELFSFHQEIPFEENLDRLVESTNNIIGRKLRYDSNPKGDANILNSVDRAEKFIASKYYDELNADLFTKVKKVRNEILIATLIDNVNIRGRVIEYLITHGNSDNLSANIIKALQKKEPLPEIKTDNDLGDYNKNFDLYDSKTDIKTKILYLKSAPKAFNIDKLLTFLSKDKSIYLIYFVGFESNNEIKTFLCSVFNTKLLEGTGVQFHWAGRNSRGVAQFNGAIIDDILNEKLNIINKNKARKWLQYLISI